MFAAYDLHETPAPLWIAQAQIPLGKVKAGWQALLGLKGMQGVEGFASTGASSCADVTCRWCNYQSFACNLQ